MGIEKRDTYLRGETLTSILHNSVFGFFKCHVKKNKKKQTKSLSKCQKLPGKSLLFTPRFITKVYSHLKAELAAASPTALIS